MKKPMKSLLRTVFAPFMLFAMLHLAMLLMVPMHAAAQGLLKDGALRNVADAIGPKRGDHIEVELIAHQNAAVPGSELWVGLRMKHDPHWHTYWRNPGDSGLATQLSWSLPDGWSAGTIAWPTPQRLPVPPLANYGYEGEVLLAVPLKVPASAVPGGEAHISLSASWLICKDVCIPGDARLGLRLPVAQTAGASASQAFFVATKARLPVNVTSSQNVLRLAKDQAALVVPKVFWENRSKDLAELSAFDFFPFTESVVQAPASQKLYSLADGAKALVLQLTAEAASTPSLDLKGVLALESKKTDGSIHRVGFEMSPQAVGLASAKNYKEELERIIASGKAELESSIAKPAIEALAAPGAPPEGAPKSLAFALGLALLGGALLNLMPCVFPVLGLKVMSLARSGAGGRIESLKAGTWFSLGIMASFLFLAGVLLALRQAGQAVGWGFQLQSPWVIAALALLFVAIALNFFGTFEVGTSTMQVAGNLDQKTSSHFASGVLAALVATPCTAPFMGSAVGFTVGQDALTTLTVFGAVGLGMAIPYLLLAGFPSWLKVLPKPGAWMETFKQVLGFPMLLTVIWLAWVFAQLTTIDASAWLLSASLLFAFALWCWGRSQRNQGKSGKRFLLAGLVALALGGAMLTKMPIDASSTKQVRTTIWQAYDELAINSALAKGNTVFIDFTAAWCISCQANKALVFESAEGISVLSSANISLFRADWTRRDERITQALARLGRNGVPVYLVMKPGKPSELLPELLTTAILKQALLN